MQKFHYGQLIREYRQKAHMTPRHSGELVARKNASI